MVSIRTVKRKNKKFKNGIAYQLDLTKAESEEFGLFPSGKGKRTTRGTYRTKTEAKDAIKKLVSEATHFKKTYDETPTLKEAYEEWLEITDIRESTKDNYRDCWVHLVPLANKRLSKITRTELRELLEGLPFSRGRVEQVSVLVNHCYRISVDRDLIQASPTYGLKLNLKRPCETREVRFWDQRQTNEFLQIRPKPRFHLFYLLALHTGCRKGELLGLQWDCVDFENNTIYIAGTYDSRYKFRDPKEPHSKRTIKLRQDEMTALKEAFDPELTWVFQNPGGTEPVGSSSIQNEFYALTDRLALPHIGLHGLRHTNATLSLLAGNNIETVSKRLGHANVSMTYDNYRHVLPEVDESLANSLGDLIG